MNRFPKANKKKRTVIRICSLLLLVISLSALIYWALPDSLIQNMFTFDNSVAFFSLFIAAVSAWLIAIQLRDSKKLQEAEFIVNLNQTFVDNPGYAKIYSAIEQSDRENIEPQLTRVEVSNYLTFFETIYLLVETGAIKMKTLDDLFEYRFFLVIHNETIQKMKLVDAPFNFRNIYYLEYIWIKYRKENGLSIYKEENCLALACKRAGKEQQYNEIIKNKEGKRK